MNGPGDDVADMLLAESEFSFVLGTDLFVGKEPSDPDNSVTIFEPYSDTPQLTLEGQANSPYEKLSLQIRVRNRHYQAGRSLINRIYLSLHGRAHETWNGTVYEVITSTAPMHFDWDDNRRARFIININLQRR